MSDTTSQTELKSRYADRIQDDIAHNESELKRISEEIAALQAELGTLEENRALLESMLKSLGSGNLPPLPPPATEKAVGKAAGKVPRQKARDTTAPKPAQAKKTREAAAAPAKAAKPAKATKAAAATKPSAPAAPAAEKSEPQGSTLVDLIVSQLGSETSPRSAAEITSTLQKVYPKREFSTKVVRNTLEALVAKARAERTRQQRSVFYVALPAPGSPAKGATDTKAKADTKAGADKAVESKAAAKDGAA